MSFHYSAQNVRVDDGHILRASLQKGDGSWNDAEIDLNDHVGNVNGNFTWDGSGFANSAQNIQFSIEEAAAVLRATLMDGEGNGQDRDLNLGERIVNNDGNFQYN